MKEKTLEERIHDKGCDKIVKDFTGKGYMYLRNIPYKEHPNDINDTGEIDLIFYKPNYERIIVIEYKTNRTKNTWRCAKKQLWRMEDKCQFLKPYRLSKMYAYGIGNTYGLKKVIKTK